ncbi:cell adhesion molecule 2-like isoform X1 [Poecilia latipinna]|nr:PREDICTED: cell adhesion molecule 2-like isoform X1 [Poecilia latipinna]
MTQEVKMNSYSTPSPLTQASTDAYSTVSDLVTKIGKKDIYSSTEDLAALIGGIITVVLLVFLCTIAVLLWCLSRQKGSYVTNETEDDEEEDNEDDESVGSDVALQSKEPLKTDKED